MRAGKLPAGLDLEDEGWLWWKGQDTDLLAPFCMLSGCSSAGRKQLPLGRAPYWEYPVLLFTFQIQCQSYFLMSPHTSDVFPEQPHPPPMSICFQGYSLLHLEGIRAGFLYLCCQG